MLYETAVQQIVGPALAAHARDEDRDDQLEAAFANYLAVGVTGAREHGQWMAKAQNDRVTM